MNTINKLLFHPSFNDTINEINKFNIKLPTTPLNQEMDFSLYTYPQDGKLVSSVEDIKSYVLDAENGQSLANDGMTICAYDESINKFAALEGTAFLTSHSLIIHNDKEYLPSNFVTFYFYTRAKALFEKSDLIKYSEDPETDSKKDYVKDRIDFIVNNTPENSILFIDGPLIGGQVSSYTVKLNNELLNKNVIPVFFVKNSLSNLVTDHVEELRGKYNSDMHWAYKSLKPGERTNLFRYVDRHNDQNAKIFCYLKGFDLSPQRVEIHSSTFEKYSDKIVDILDLAYYLLLVQGDLKNPQIRSIIIAEKYARATIKLIDIDKMMKSAGVIPTMNQERFGR